MAAAGWSLGVATSDGQERSGEATSLVTSQRSVEIGVLSTIPAPPALGRTAQARRRAAPATAPRPRPAPARRARAVSPPPPAVVTPPPVVRSQPPPVPRPAPAPPPPSPPPPPAIPGGAFIEGET
ncbi:MAG: hypothetical protein Q8O56_04125 [Solirubrobacteraceae bacterium]|nr:hypothetical protein [Solirubrobacteraceae bacterium]